MGNGTDLNYDFYMIEPRKWDDDLIWCPSQCYYYFESGIGNKYCIYLRWRWSDPWTASLVKFLDNDWNWNKTKWTDIDLDKEYCDIELDELKVAVMKKIIELFRIEGIKRKGDN